MSTRTTNGASRLHVSDLQSRSAGAPFVLFQALCSIRQPLRTNAEKYLNQATIPSFQILSNLLFTTGRSSTLKMEAAPFFEISVSFFNTKRLHSPKDGMALPVVNVSNILINSAQVPLVTCNQLPPWNIEFLSSIQVKNFCTHYEILKFSNVLKITLHWTPS